MSKKSKKSRKSVNNSKKKGKESSVVKTIKISEELLDKLQYLKICNPCESMRTLTGGKRHSLVMWKKKKCVMCGNRTKPYKLPHEIRAEAAELEAKMGVGAKDKAFKAIIEHIQKRAADFDCPGSIVDVIKGPIVTEYKFKPDRYTRVKKLKALDEDLALGLEVDNVSIRRIPKESSIGIQVPNAVRDPVTFDSCMPNVLAHANDMELPLNFGITSDGSPFVEDLTRYPHLLIGGSTGSGKSVLLSQLLTNLIAVRSPQQVQFVMIDPKTVELFPYQDIPHMYRPPVSSIWRVVDVLEDIVKVMRSRTTHLADYKVHSIKELNELFKGEAGDLQKQAVECKKKGKLEEAAKLAERAKQKLDLMWPYIVIIIDEMAEIVLENKKDFIQRLAAISSMARAAGICVIAATQRPSVDVLPGKVKVNFLARASLKVPSATDSKTVLTEKGAESLLNRGDMFLRSPDQSALMRIHVAHCKKEDRDQIIKRAVNLKDYKDGLLQDFPKE